MFSQDIEPQVKKYGKISEKGWLYSLNKKGFNTAQCFNELIDNSIDAKATHIQIKNSHEFMLFIDNGKGMTYEEIVNLACAYGENHAESEHIGNAGIGSKCATKILSNDNNVVIYSKSVKDQYVKCEIPWDKIMEKGTYTGEINVSYMDKTETVEFKKILEEINSDTGTCFVIPSDKNIYNELEQQFDDEKQKMIDPNNRLGCIYGKYDGLINIIYSDLTTHRDIKLDLYSVFNQPDNDFYQGKKIFEIFVWEDQRDNRNINFLIC